MRKTDSRNNKSGIAKGKLVDKYRNMLSFLRKYKLVSSSESENSNQYDENSDEGLLK